jgi:2'-5' RNA ligase
MTSMARPVANLRLFVAIHPPLVIARQLLDAAAALDLPPHRETPPDQVHVTLQFIGDVPVRDLDRVIESVRRSASGLGRFELCPQRLITLPARGQSRLVAAETDQPPTILELKSRLVTRLAHHARREGKRPYRPHLTLVRFRPSNVSYDEHLEVGLTFEVDRITLLKSVLRPSGAEHLEVAAAELD